MKIAFHRRGQHFEIAEEGSGYIGLQNGQRVVAAPEPHLVARGLIEISGKERLNDERHTESH